MLWQNLERKGGIKLPLRYICFQHNTTIDTIHINVGKIYVLTPKHISITLKNMYHYSCAGSEVTM